MSDVIRLKGFEYFKFEILGMNSGPNIDERVFKYMVTRYFSTTALLCATLLCSSFYNSAFADVDASLANATAEQEIPKIDLNTLTIIGYHEITEKADAVMPAYAVSSKQFELHLT